MVKKNDRKNYGYKLLSLMRMATENCKIDESMGVIPYRRVKTVEAIQRASNLDTCTSTKHFMLTKFLSIQHGVDAKLN